MSFHQVKGKYKIYKNRRETERKFRNKLSQQVSKEFGKGLFNAEENLKILDYTISYYVTEFEKICHKETSLQFYRCVLFLHEQPTELTHTYTNEDFCPRDIENLYCRLPEDFEVRH